MAAAVLIAACNGDNRGTSHVDPDDPVSLIVWTANLEHLLPEHDWTAFVERATAAPRAPDLLFLSELTRGETRTVVEALGAEAGLDYAFDHAPIGNNAVVWATDRFGGRSGEAPLLWQPWGAEGCSEPSESDPNEVVAVHLTDTKADVDVVAVAVHWGRTWAAQCMEKNLTSLDDRIEDRWPDRALTVVAGDLNAHPDKQPVAGRPDVESLDSGRETDPDCWYRAFSALHDQMLENARPTEDDRDCANDPHYSATADSYVDAVFVANDDEQLCDQWTSIHGAPVADGSSCTDLNDDGLRDRGRIDYIWLRWEDGGEPILPTIAQAEDLVGDAAADDICILDSCAETRYSDHRGVYAEVQPNTN